MAYTGCLSGEAGAEERSGKGQNHGSGMSATQRLSKSFIMLFDLIYAQYLVRIIGLFQGRVIDKPEDMLETEYATGGEVEHQVRTSLYLDLLISLNTALRRSS